MKNYIIICCMFLAIVQNKVGAQTEVPLRRSISPSNPMWLIHIDTWNYADPQKIIDLVPQDIRPYVVMNISLSISHDEATSRFKVAEYGYEIAKSWLRTCAQNQMWAIVQPSSGGFSQFSDFDLSVYEEFYRDFPNLIGFNYCEQFWGFNSSTDPLSAQWSDRMAHFANLLELSNHYGGYLVVSWCANQWSPVINPIAMMKRNPAFAEACREYTENYILCEKYTQTSYLSDMESLCLGACLSGYSGQYGIRYDDTGWTDDTGKNENFTLSTGGAAHLEHIMLTGQTVIDGPELIWQQCFRETNRVVTTDGYTKRNWETFPQFDNVSVDIFRKILDGTVRIPSRQEIIDRTKVVIINDVNSGSNDDIYSSPETMFEGLYRMNSDGNYENNRTFFKKTGRYPTIPTVYLLDDTLANSFQVQVNKSDYITRWPTITDKVSEFNSLFPSEYTGDLYAGRHENGWVIYNPFKTGQTASASIPFKYNTCDRVDLSYSQYTSSVMKEYSNKLTFYLCNYDNEIYTGLKPDTIKIYGSSSEPTYSWTDRGNHQASVVTKSWSGGVFTLTVKHNGSIDITVNCSGTGTGRLTSYTEATLTSPDKPSVYLGPRQYEAEHFDYKNISSITTAGYDGNIRNYTGQGYLRFGTNASSSIRDTVYALRSGIYQLKTKYSVSGGDVNTIDLYVNGVNFGTPTFMQTETESDWNINTQTIELNAGKNIITFTANASGTYNIYFDNIVITQGTNNGIYNFSNDIATTEASDPAAELISVKSGTAGVVSYTDVNSDTSNCFKTYSNGPVNETGVADLEMFPQSSINYTVLWKSYYGTAGSNKGILLRGTGENGSCSYADGMKQGYLFIVQENADSSITLKTYIADSNSITEQTTYTTGFKIIPESACWFRATATEYELIFECSNDSTNWVGGSYTTFTDSSYSFGSTQLVWGLGSVNFDWVMDNITYLPSNMTLSRYYIDDLRYTQGSGPSFSQSFNVSGSSLMEDIIINASENFEISTSLKTGYDSTLTLTNDGGIVSTTTVYVRLKTRLPVQKFSGNLSLSSKGIPSRNINLTGEVTPQPSILKYDFSKDVAGTSASTPPALNTSIGIGNTATAGVVSYTDANGVTSNMFSPYSSGQRNSTGVVDLNLFSRKATDYSVTWKQCIVSGEYKVGVLLRGDTNNIGDASTGYVEGLMHGYLFIVYNTGSRSEFRIYPSSSNTSLSWLINTSVSSLIPTAGQPVWYRASVSGISPVSLTFEYSTDSISWNIGTSTTDNSATAFTSGATQIVWGLGVSNVNFYMDNIIFYGLTENSSSLSLPEVIEASDIFVDGLNYMERRGPSYSKSFSVWGSPLTGNMEVQAPYGFEVTLDTTQGFTPVVTLPITGDSVAQTTIYVRMKSGLAQNSYSENIIISSPDVLNRMVKLFGVVNPGAEITIKDNESELTGFDYILGSGPSNRQSLYVSGTLLFDDITVVAPDNYEISLSSGSDYGSIITFMQTNGNVSSTRFYIRLKSDLPIDTYEGDITLNSAFAIEKRVSLSGSVIDPATKINNLSVSDTTVVSIEYYTISGQRVSSIDNLKGIYIVKKLMSDGSVSTYKIVNNSRK